MGSQVIRKTKSVCPVCLGVVDASVVARDGKAWMEKSCPRHGDFRILLSNRSECYKRLNDFYFSVMEGKKKVLEYEIWPTRSCNMSCPICSLGDIKQHKADLVPSCADIEDVVRKCKASFFTLSGGEPTCRPDLGEIIAILRKHHKTAIINTNGLKFTNIDYLKDLVRAGLERVNLQFDGFKREVYPVLRGVDLLDVKLKVLANLKALRVPVILNVTIAKNLNEGEISGIIDYAAKNEFINGVTFFTICNIGGAGKWPLDNYIVPDEVVGILEQQTRSRISSESFYLFQKLHMSLKSFLSQKTCFYNRVYVLVRNDDGGYRPIDELIGLKRLEPVLDQYHALFLKDQFIAKLYFALFFPIALLANTSPSILKEFFLMAVSYFFKTRHYLGSGRFLSVSISTSCDPFKMDYGIVKNCQNEIICVDERSGKFGHQGSICLYGMGLEKPRHE